MKSSYKPISELVERIDIRNSDGDAAILMGLSIDKCFIHSVANTVGTDLTKYKVICKNQFAVSLMQVSRDSKIPVACFREYDRAIMSPAYSIFQVADESVVLPDYLDMWFKRPEFDREAAFVAVGGVRGSMPWEEFARIKVHVPTLERQRKIVDAYKAVNERIHIKQQLNDNLEAQLSGVYHRFFDAPGNSVPGLISDLGEVVGGATPSTDNPEYFCDDAIAWISPKDLTGTGLKFIYRGELCITESAYNSCSTKLMPAGTVLFTSRAPVGTVAIAMNDICTNQGFKSVIPKKEIGTAFVYYFLKENKQLIESHASGTTFMEVSGTVLKSIPAIVPKPEVASRFAAICMPLFEEQRQNELEIGRLQELRQTLISSISSR